MAIIQKDAPAANPISGDWFVHGRVLGIGDKVNVPGSALVSALPRHITGWSDGDECRSSLTISVSPPSQAAAVPVSLGEADLVVAMGAGD